jgi:hypothetical protein
MGKQSKYFNPVILSFVFRIPSLESGIERGPEKVQRLSEQKTGTSRGQGT